MAPLLALRAGLSASNFERPILTTLYAGLGQRQEAYRFLEKVYKQHLFPDGLMFDSCWGHEDPQFKAIARKIGLMQ